MTVRAFHGFTRSAIGRRGKADIIELEAGKQHGRRGGRKGDRNTSG